MSATLTRFDRETIYERDREKLVNCLKRDYPRLGDEIEDFLHMAVVSAQFRDFTGEEKFRGYLLEKTTFLIIDAMTQRAERRKSIKGLPKHKHSPDPMRLIDWKIDLERAITKSTNDDKMRSALWHHIYEGYTQEDIAETTGKDQGTISRAIKEVRKIMRRGGYRDGVSSHV